MEPTDKRLAVLSVAYPFAPVGQDATGDAEQVLTSMDEALVEAGHRSIVIACEGSATAGTLVPIALPDRFDARGTAHVRAQVRAALERELARHDLDLVHLHGMDFNAYVPQAGIPLLATLHLPVHWYPQTVFWPKRPDTHLHCVSAVQRHACPRGARLLGDIPQGVPLERFAAPKSGEDFVLTLGRISPERECHLALDAARSAGVKMMLAGKVFPYESHQEYFRRDVTPRLDASRIFIGPLGAAARARALAAARCVLVPSSAEGTCVMVVMEALASGTPVIAFRKSGLADLVDDGKTGFLVSTVAEMASAIGRSVGFRADDCRKVAEERFSAREMRKTYLALYQRLAFGTSAAAEAAAVV